MDVFRTIISVTKTLFTFIFTWIFFALKSITSKEGLKEIALAMGTGGGSSGGGGFVNTLTQKTIQGLNKAVLKSVMGMEKFNFKNLGIGIAMSTIASIGAQEIGEKYNIDKSVDYAQHKGLHFLSGLVTGSVESALKGEKDILKSAITRGAAAVIAEGIFTDGITYFAKAKAEHGDKFDAEQTEKDWLKHAQTCKNIAQIGTATLALTLNADVNKAISSAQNAGLPVQKCEKCCWP
jgi:hypothetical protein